MPVEELGIERLPVGAPERADLRFRLAALGAPDEIGIARILDVFERGADLRNVSEFNLCRYSRVFKRSNN